MKLLSILIITFLQISSLAWAQSDTIPKKNKERKFHAGIFYSVGLSYVSALNDNGFQSTSYSGLYQNWGLMLERKIYKKFWPELNANTILSRGGQINFARDTANIDMQLRNGKENTVLLYLKYKVLQKKRINIMAKLGLGFGTIFSEIYTRNNKTKQTEFHEQFSGIGNVNYYSFCMRVDANYQLNKHIILFNQFVYNAGGNILEKRYLGIRTSDTNDFVQLTNVTPHTLIYSLGTKF